MGFLAFLLLVAGLQPCDGQHGPAVGDQGVATSLPGHYLTNTVQFKSLSVNDYLADCTFRLQGVVTLVDPNRHLMVLQDATGALALHFNWPGGSLKVGELVSLEGTNCYPYVVGFPDFPYRPSGGEVRKSFEAPTDWGEYYLTRMRGGLHPPVTGEYTFWIASDNSSELWLSQDANPSKARKIAFIPNFGWVNPRDWSRFPSQRSETIHLEAGSTYYIEARQEQTTQGDNLAVAWNGPGLERSVIAGHYLSPWTEDGGRDHFALTNGILREYWTNYSTGNLTVLSGPLPFESAVSVEQLKISLLGRGKLPEGQWIAFNQPLPVDKNFCRVRTEGVVKFVGVSGEGAFLELSDGEARIQVHAVQGGELFATNLCNLRVQVEGVGEMGHDENGSHVPGLIWATTETGVSLSEPAGTNLNATLLAQHLKPVPANTNSAMVGFYETHGVVTFNDCVLGRDCLFVQEDVAPIAVSIKARHFQNHLQVGEWVELGGLLQPGKFIPIMEPLVVSVMGWHPMPDPVSQPVEFPIAGDRDGQWVELEGVVRSVNSNGTLSVYGKDGLINLWIGRTPLHDLSHYEDARLRVRGVLSLTLLDSPLLLIPSRDFLNVEEVPPKGPFEVPLCSIAELPPETADYASVHRVKICGRVIYNAGQTFFMQDASGGIRVQTRRPATATIGETVAAVGYPIASGSARLLTEALLQAEGEAPPLAPRKLDTGETLSSRQNFTLVQTTATLLNQRTTGTDQVLELEEHQRVFTATLANSTSDLPHLAPGSRVRVTGVFEDGSMVSPVTAKGPVEKTAAGSLNILLRQPADVVVLTGPPWWTLRRTVALVGTLLTVLVVTLLWVYLLRRRLDRQQTARLAFSRLILQGQESERQRIAVNLHDSLGQNLLVIKNQARLALQGKADEADRQTRLNTISEMTSAAIDEVRQITRDLRPYQLDRLGLTQAIRASVNQAAENSPIQIAIYLDEIDGIFDKESEIHVYRIVQEALNNILKHSAATEAAVVVKNLADLISLSIRDNGCGFDVNTAGSSSVRDIGYGLSGMKERTRMLGGWFVVDSHPAQGASISIEIRKPIGKI